MSGSEFDTMAQVKGAGGDGRVSADELQGFLDAVSAINKQSQKYWAMRLNSEAARFQTWPGQSPDGKQREEYIGAMPFPFDGASDQRVFWADMLTSEAVRLAIVATARATVNCLPAASRKADDAWRALQVLRWFFRRMGQAWWTNLIRCANYAKGDSPAVTIMKFEWARTRPLEMKRLTAGELAALYLRLVTEDGAGEADAAVAAQDFEQALAGDDEASVLRDAILEHFDVKPARAERVVRELRETGSAEFPVAGEWDERLRVRALRYADDFYIPDGTTDFETCPLWFEVEWMDRVSLIEKRESEGWDAAWVAAVLEQEGVQSFTEYTARGTSIEPVADELHNGRYHVVTAHYQAVNEDGLRASYSCVFHAAVPGKTAYGRKLERNSAAVFFAGEVNDAWALNSRGIPERIGPAAGVMKSIKDDLCDSGRLQLLPPITGDGYGTGREETINLEPLSYIPLKRGGKLQYLSGMAYPTHIMETLRHMREDRDEQFSRQSDNVPQGVSDAATEYEVFRWLGFVQEIYRSAMRLIADNVSDATLAKITDRQGMPVAQDGRGMPAGPYDVEVVFDPRTLDEKRVIEIASALAQLKGSDTENVVYMTPLLKAQVRALAPYQADEALQRGSEGMQREQEQERANYLGLRAGILPQMVDDGTWNYALRLQFYTDLLAANPAALDDLPDDKLDLVQTWLEALEFQARQYGANREIGRSGVKTAGAPQEGATA